MSAISNRTTKNIEEHKNNIQYCNQLIDYYNQGFKTVSKERAYELYQQGIESKLELHKIGIHVKISQPDRVNL